MAYCAGVGREPSSLGLQATVGNAGAAAQWAADARRWEQAGATHLTLGAGPDPALGAMPRLERSIEVKRVLERELGY